MQFCWIGLQVETKNTGAVVLWRGLCFAFFHARSIKKTPKAFL
jgi:hypothetical protein